ncbi:unnamed protein product [Ilex paraguariensis]|uniref:LOB domain-containing protein n=1 Tax=Ilex paraguariensis TaxID=185542 RepID=A0ABC8TKS5_9AQUA
MRMSCNGCRVLRKGCSEDCTLRPCLQWIKSPESQANATIFLAKFYGRAGLLNLINGGPDHIRPVIFRSLLYEACGRIISPIHGSVGLMWSGNWHHCQSAVDAVLKGSPIMQVPIDDAAAQAHAIMPLKGCDIRHLSKESNGLHQVRTRSRFKRSGGQGKGKFVSTIESVTDPIRSTSSGWDSDQPNELNRVLCHDSFSAEPETIESNLVNRAEPVWAVKPGSNIDHSEILLELTLGLNPIMNPKNSAVEELSDGYM